MGSPKKHVKKFSKPSHPWQKERILREQELIGDYGLKRKYEIWKMNSILKNFTKQARNLITTKTAQSEKERNQLLKKLYSLGLISENAKIDDVLLLTLKDVMERRLQTLLYRKHMARTIKQARQMIVHQQVVVGEKTITAPSYLVALTQESHIKFAPSSSFADTNHPERAVLQEKKEKAPKSRPYQGREKKYGNKEVKEPKKEESALSEKKHEGKAADKKSKKEGKEEGN